MLVQSINHARDVEASGRMADALLGNASMSTVPFAQDPSKSRRENYLAYLDSGQWKETRSLALARDGHRCRVCNREKHLDVHHRTYARLFSEDLGDLTTLCRNCHELYHNETRANGKADKKQNRRLLKKLRKPIEDNPTDETRKPKVYDLGDPEKMVEYTITSDFLARLITPPAGISGRSLALIGERRHSPGWRNRCIGRKVMIDPRILREEHDAIARKALIKRTISPFASRKTVVTNNEVADIRRALRRGMTVKNVSKKFLVAQKVVSELSRSQFKVIFAP